MRYRYPWPASALTKADMALLHACREATHPRVPITMLLAEAVRYRFASTPPSGESGATHALSPTMKGTDEIHNPIR